MHMVLCIVYRAKYEVFLFRKKEKQKKQPHKTLSTLSVVVVVVVDIFKSGICDEKN